jgi:hypothetical protein
VRLVSLTGGATGGSGNLFTSLSNVARVAAHPKFVWVCREGRPGSASAFQVEGCPDWPDLSLGRSSPVACLSPLSSVVSSTVLLLTTSSDSSPSTRSNRSTVRSCAGPLLRSAAETCPSGGGHPWNCTLRHKHVQWNAPQPTTPAGKSMQNNFLTRNFYARLARTPSGALT